MSRICPPIVHEGTPKALPAPASGYLALELGDVIEILHVGSQDKPDEKGWAYGKLCSAGHQQDDSRARLEGLKGKL